MKVLRSSGSIQSLVVDIISILYIYIVIVDENLIRKVVVPYIYIKEEKKHEILHELTVR